MPGIAPTQKKIYWESIAHFAHFYHAHFANVHSIHISRFEGVYPYSPHWFKVTYLPKTLGILTTRGEKKILTSMYPHSE